MNNRYKFRGKYDGEWKYGDLTHNQRGQSFIMINMGEGYDVIPETVGQYTGLKDKNDVEIYEGDVVSSYGKVFKAVVEFENGIFQPFNDRDTCIFYADECEILGNIHDNPELLGGAE